MIVKLESFDEMIDFSHLIGEKYILTQRVKELFLIIAK